MAFYDDLQKSLKQQYIPNMTKDEMYEKYSSYGLPLNNARLYYCLENRLDIKYIKELIELGVDLEYRDDEHKLPLWEAIKHKNSIEVVKALKEAYYDENDLCECIFDNPNIGCRCCELNDNPENEENFYMIFNATLIEYLHILYFKEKDSEYLKYFELFDISPITDIKELKDEWCIDFYELYLNFFYIICDHEKVNNIDISHIEKKYPQYINYSNCSEEYCILYHNIIDSMINNNIELFKNSNMNYNINSIHEKPLHWIAVELNVTTDFFKYLYEHIRQNILYFETHIIWENKDTVTDLFIYKIEDLIDLIIILYNTLEKETYKDYYNILSISDIDI